MSGARLVPNGLRLRLLLLVLLAGVPALCLTLYAHLERRRQETTQVQTEALRLARLASADLERVIEATSLLLGFVAQLPEVRSGEAEACSVQLTRMRDHLGTYSSLGVIGADGVIFCSALPAAVGLYVGDRTYVQRAIASRGFAVGDYQIGRASKTANVNFGYPIFDDDGSVRSIVYAALNLARLNRYAADAQLPPGVTLTAFDRGGTILVRHPDPEPWIGQSGLAWPLLGELLGRSGEGTAEGVDIDDVQRLFAFAPLAERSTGGASVLVGVPTEQAYAETNRALGRNLLVLIVVGVIAVCGAWLGTDRFIVHPLKALLAATRRLSAGELDARVGRLRGPGELSQLARAFDEMAAALGEAEGRRRREEDLRRKNFELEQQNLSIQEANRLKTEFVSMVSHEMRTPLTSIQGYLYVLLEGAAGQLSDEQQRFVNVAQRNADRLLTLIADLLDLSRIEAGRLELHRRSVDLGEAILTVLESLRPLVRSKEQTIQLELADRLTPVWADPDRLIQILTNFVSNAHKYTPAGGQIWIAARTEAGRAEVAVRDDGIGMSAEEQAQLFTKFFRADNSAARGVGGTGLGLAITRSLVELHGGEITVVSAPGQGSTFVFSLPTATDEGVPTPIGATEDGSFVAAPH